MATVEDLAAFKNSFKAFKGHVSRHMTTVQGLLSTISRYPTERLPTLCIKSLNLARDRLQLQLNRFEDYLIKVADVLSEEQLTPFQKDFEKVFADVQQVLASVSDVNFDFHTRPELPRSTSLPSSVPSSSPTKINQALKPERLLSSCTLSKFRSWRTNFELYYSSNQMHNFPVDEQQGYLRSCLELKLQQILQA